MDGGGTAVLLPLLILLDLRAQEAEQEFQLDSNKYGYEDDECRLNSPLLRICYLRVLYNYTRRAVSLLVSWYNTL